MLTAMHRNRRVPAFVGEGIFSNVPVKPITGDCLGEEGYDKYQLDCLHRNITNKKG